MVLSTERTYCKYPHGNDRTSEPAGELTLNVQDSQVTDPFDGRERRFRNYQRGRFTLTTRHDIPEWRFNWGTQYFDRLDGGMFNTTSDFEFSGEPFYGIFAEITAAVSLTVLMSGSSPTDLSVASVGGTKGDVPMACSGSLNIAAPTVNAAQPNHNRQLLKQSRIPDSIP